ncbi:MAG: twin-arginine translocase subunit TatC [Alistipes sp.]|nr:twin-arginine translocase subunit TatC [Alistipes sp.]
MQGEQNFWDHLDTLRAGVLRVAAFLMVGMIALFVAMPTLFQEVILAPTEEDFILYRWIARLAGSASIFGSKPLEVELINIHVASQFTTHLSASFYGALLLTVPYLLYEIWRFISPALYPRELRGVRIAFVSGGGLFYAGCLIGYLIVFPIMFRFLAQYSLSDAIATQISLQSYMNNFWGMTLTMGLAFELPIVVWLLSALGLVKRAQLRAARRYVVCALLVVAALITPSGDPFTLAVVFLPLYLLYEAGILCAKAK